MIIIESQHIVVPKPEKLDRPRLTDSLVVKVAILLTGVALAIVALGEWVDWYTARVSSRHWDALTKSFYRTAYSGPVTIPVPPSIKPTRLDPNLAMKIRPLAHVLGAEVGTRTSDSYVWIQILTAMSYDRTSSLSKLLDETTRFVGVKWLQPSPPLSLHHPSARFGQEYGYFCYRNYALLVAWLDGDDRRLGELLIEQLEYARSPFPSRKFEDILSSQNLSNVTRWWGAMGHRINDPETIHQAIDIVELWIAEIDAAASIDLFHRRILDSGKRFAPGTTVDFEVAARLGITDFQVSAMANSAFTFTVQPRSWPLYNSYTSTKRVAYFSDVMLTSVYRNNLFKLPRTLHEYERTMLKLLRLYLMQRLHEIDSSHPTTLGPSLPTIDPDYMTDPLSPTPGASFLWDATESRWFSVGADGVPTVRPTMAHLDDDLFVVVEPLILTPQFEEGIRQVRAFMESKSLTLPPFSWHEQDRP